MLALNISKPFKSRVLYEWKTHIWRHKRTLRLIRTRGLWCSANLLYNPYVVCLLWILGVLLLMFISSIWLFYYTKYITLTYYMWCMVAHRITDKSIRAMVAAFQLQPFPWLDLSLSATNELWQNSFITWNSALPADELYFFNVVIGYISYMLITRSYLFILHISYWYDIRKILKMPHSWSVSHGYWLTNTS